MDGWHEIVALANVRKFMGVLEPCLLEQFIESSFSNSIKYAGAEDIHFKFRLCDHGGEGKSLESLQVLESWCGNSQMIIFLFEIQNLRCLDRLSVLINLLLFLGGCLFFGLLLFLLIHILLFQFFFRFLLALFFFPFFFSFFYGLFKFRRGVDPSHNA